MAATKLFAFFGFCLTNLGFLFSVWHITLQLRDEYKYPRPYTAYYGSEKIILRFVVKGE